MDQEEITLPAPPCGYKYKLVRDKTKKKFVHTIVNTALGRKNPT